MYKALISFCSEELDIKQGDILASDFASADVIADLLEAEYIEVYTDPSGGATIEVVTELPETGESNVIYLVPKQDTGTDNIFDEYIWVDNDWELIGSTDIDLSNYYTKSEVDGKLPPIYVLNTTNQLRDDYGTQSLEANAKTMMGNIITDAVSKGYKNIAIMVCSTEYGKTYMTYSVNNLSANTTQIDFYSDYTQSNRSGSQYICYKYLRSTGSWNNNVYACNSLAWEPYYYLLLTASNTTSYSVSNNYTPAHKKYVDDAIAAIQPSGGSNYPFYVANLGVGEQGTGFENGYTFSSSDKQTMAGIINDAYSKGFKAIDFILTKDDNTARPITFSNSVDNEYWGSSIQTQPTEITWYATWLSNRFDTYNVPTLGSSQITLQLSWSNNVVTVTNGWYYTEEIMIATITNTVNYSVSDSFIPAHKQYVDTLPTTYSGYDSSKTQILKNVNGTLTWVDE